MRNCGTCLVVVADDFGRSSSVNRAVADAHVNGIVTAASIMAGGEAFEEAVQIARNHESLSVGLHLTLCGGNAVLPPSAIPDLVGESGRFEDSPSRAWMRYSRAGLMPQIDREIEAQFDRLKKAGIRPSHVDSHHHIHMHPSVFSLLFRHASRRGIRWVRMPREPLSQIFGSGGRGVLSFIEWTVFRVLSASHKKKIRLHGLRTADRVYGLSRTGRLDEEYLLKIMRSLLPGSLALSGAGALSSGVIHAAAGKGSGANRPDAIDVIEIFSHPDAETRGGRREWDALLSPAVRDVMALRGVTLAGYRELSGRKAAACRTAGSFIKI